MLSQCFSKNLSVMSIVFLFKVLCLLCVTLGKLNFKKCIDIPAKFPCWHLKTQMLYKKRKFILQGTSHSLVIKLFTKFFCDKHHLSLQSSFADCITLRTLQFKKCKTFLPNCLVNPLKINCFWKFNLSVDSCHLIGWFTQHILWGTSHSLSY